MNKTELKKTVIVVGAGIAGLLAAHELTKKNVKVIVVDKGNRVGGRMATRMDGKATWDTGAQFFTTRDPEFRYQVQQWEQEQVAHLWCRGFPEVGITEPVDGYERYCGTHGMNSIPAFLAKKLDIRLGQAVVAVENSGDSWKVSLEQGDNLYGQGMILTPPVPQSLQLLKQGNVKLPQPDHQTLTRMEYHPCLALLVELTQTSRIPRPGALRMDGEVLYWLADNQIKGISPEIPTATLHAGPLFSRTHWNTPDDVVSDRMLAAAREWIQPDRKRVFLKRWRYSQPVEIHPERCLVVKKPESLIFAGDAFGGPRVEGAALSGMTAGRLLAEMLTD